MHPILLSLGPVQIYSFGVFLVLAILAASFLIWQEGRAKGFEEEKIIDLLLFVAFFGLLGARISYLILHFQDFGLAFFKWFLFFHFPGLNYLGAILGGLVGLFIFCKKYQWPFYQAGDFLVLGVVFGEAIGRVGAFLSGNSYGTISSLPWAVSMIGLVGKRHPVQLYESFITFIIFLILIKSKSWLAEKKLPTGLVFLTYLFLFGASKFVIEFLRGDSVYFNGWRINQVIYLIFISISGVLIYKRLGRTIKGDLLLVFNKVRSLKLKKTLSLCLNFL